MFTVIALLLIIIPPLGILGVLDLFHWNNLGDTWSNCNLAHHVWKVKNKHPRGLNATLLYEIQGTNFRLPKYFEKFSDQQLLKKILNNTVIVFDEHVVYDQGIDVGFAKGLARTLTLFFRFWKPIYICEISLHKINYMNSEEIAALVVHEVTHHYLKETTGNYWGGDKFQPAHNHEMWKQIGV